jgi:hypothetical protein
MFRSRLFECGYFDVENFASIGQMKLTNRGCGEGPFISTSNVKPLPSYALYG